MVNIILAFIIIKFLVYPGLGFILGTSHPIVAVVSGSMEHDGSLDNWWNFVCCENSACIDGFRQSQVYEEYSISKSLFTSFPFKNGFDKGDMMVLFSPKSINNGDVIVFGVSHRLDPIIHRVVKIQTENSSIIYTTKGDHNCGSAEFEKGVPKNRIVGKAVIRIPLLGWIKIGFVELINAFRGV